MRLKEMFDFRGEFAEIYLKKCVPILCNELLYGVGQMLINIVIGRQEESAIAAMAAFRVLEGFVFAFFGGLADAATVIVGKEVGAGKHMRGYQDASALPIVCPIVTFVIVSVCVIFNRQLLGLFGLGSRAMEYGRYMLLIYLAAGTIRTCNYIMNSCYRAGWRGSVWNCAGDQLSVPDQCACHLDCRNPPSSALPGCICLCVYGRADPVDL